MFVVGKSYRRATDIHEHFGGQRRGGIATPKEHRAVFLFTSPGGEELGYIDGFVDGVFMYTGEGQLGDMKMQKGNLAIRDHKTNGKKLYLFEKQNSKSPFVNFVGEAECIGYHEEKRPDRDGNLRNVFVFHLTVDSIFDKEQVYEPRKIYGDYNETKLRNSNLRELRVLALAAVSAFPDPSPREQAVITRLRSEAIKLYVLKRSKGICEGCGDPAPFETKSGPFLECHHMNRLADGGPDHPENVVAVCPNCHRRAHYAMDSKEYNQTLRDKVKLVEAELAL
ncbi:5-methylcytosine-specific restriction enzyme A [Pseudidiomarina maritima]|uniref:5-methylcytosine-specific restriction enzyme A n=1 Tax=Pseudidiomarina maritima TaxID=519453 RepID=A0A1I6H7I5_9GAMM|nr:HNH endonuclease [Pseudidiomarina maritima]SFR50340.1 5-methylcytosine-specific restriction enzyme A [Pseudidiomarina maritima]